jgi:serine/threonine protein kinase
LPDLQGMTLQDRYLVGDRAARGPNATIFRATVLDTGDTVALKAFDALARQSPPFIAAFRGLSREARAINSPCVVPLLAYGQSGGTYYQVAEWTGDAVPSRLRLDGRVNVGQAVGLAAEAAAGLAVLHHSNLIHGHLKLSNIRRRLGGSVAIAGAGEPLLVNIEQLAQGDPSNSAAYLSPEQILSQPLSPRTDLYTLGVILYQLATGQVPFSGPDAAATLRSHIEQVPISPRELNPEIDPRLDALIGRLLIRDPAGRAGSAEELRDELLAIQSLYPEPAPAASSTASTGEAEARRGWMARLFRTRQDGANRGPRTDGTELSAPSLLD